MVQEQVDVWEGDLLGREAEAMYLQRYLENVFDMDAAGKSSFVLNINSEWGHGKTWFLKRLSEQLGKNHPVVYFDAWKNDFTKDALLSFVSVICTDLSEQFKGDAVVKGRIDKVVGALSSFTKKAIPIVAAVLVKQATGMASDRFTGFGETLKEDVSDAASDLANAAATCVVEEFTQKKSAIENFEYSVEALVEEIGGLSDVHLPIFIFVDELDRCRPTYAIELLESIKHLFSVAGVFFVVATDTKQLSHSIKAVYGQDFNSTAYLKRFFYAEYQLAEPDYERMANFLFSDFKLSEKLFMPEPLFKEYGFSGFFSKASEFFKLTARDQEQVFSILKTILLTSEKEVIHYILIIYLICAKHKLEDAGSNWKRAGYMRELIEVGKIRNVMLRSLYLSDFSVKEKDISIQDIFGVYLANLDDDFGKIKYPQRSDSHFEFKEKIAFKLLDGKTVNRSGGYTEKNDLGSYFDLLSQAGRLVVSI